MRASVDRWMAESYSEPWQAYFRAKKERKELERVGDVWVDAKNVIDRVFTCDPGCCSPGRRKRGEESCCAEFSVEITAREEKVLGEHFEGISRFLAARDPDWAQKSPALSDVVVPHEDNRFQRALGKRKRRCAFSFLDERRAIRCGVHGYCLEEGFDVHTVKPKLCFLFPLLVQDMQDGTWILTVIDEENSGLVGFTSFEQLPCLKGEETFGTLAEGGPAFYDDHRSTLTHLFGKPFMNQLDDLAARRGRRTKGDDEVIHIKPRRKA
jgi:hypothetical protein